MLNAPHQHSHTTPAEPKNIVICCDGTGNVIGENQSNVVKLVRTILRDHKGQCVFYDPGVGTLAARETTTKTAKKIDKLMGLAFGVGIRRNIEEAYLYLMEHYNPGDKVFMFGFSRGAYTVCSLAALLHSCGLLEKGNENLVQLALNVYQNSKTKPDDAQLLKATFSRECKPHFLGIWDTVASVGIVMNGNPFPSAAMNPDVRHIRHAVSIDERRAKFQVEQWVTPDTSKEQTVKEVWFAGVHSDVGGGYAEEESGLSKIALEWMLSEAIEEGLQIDEIKCIQTLGLTEEVAGYEKQDNHLYHEMALPYNYIAHTHAPDHLDVLHDSHTLPWKILDLILSISPKVSYGRPRSIPPKAHIHESVLKRWRDRKTENGQERYQPENLQPIIAMLPANWEKELENPYSSALPDWVVRRKRIDYAYQYSVRE